MNAAMSLPIWLWAPMLLATVSAVLGFVAGYRAASVRPTVVVEPIPRNQDSELMWLALLGLFLVAGVLVIVLFG